MYLSTSNAITFGWYFLISLGTSPLSQMFFKDTRSNFGILLICSSSFEVLAKKTQKTLKREFLLLEGLESDNKIDWIQERTDQMNKYRNLQNCLDGASVIMDVVEEFELEGDFKAIEEMFFLVSSQFCCHFPNLPEEEIPFSRFSGQIAHRCFLILKTISLQFLVYGVSAPIP
jgi:hypothetical protein